MYANTRSFHNPQSSNIQRFHCVFLRGFFAPVVRLVGIFSWMPSVEVSGVSEVRLRLRDSSYTSPQLCKFVELCHCPLLRLRRPTRVGVQSLLSSLLSANSWSLSITIKWDASLFTFVTLTFVFFQPTLRRYLPVCYLDVAHTTSVEKRQHLLIVYIC